MQSVQIFASRTGWLDTYKKYIQVYEIATGGVLCGAVDKLPRIPFDREQGIIDLANRMAVA